MTTRLVSVVIPSLISLISSLGAAGRPVDYQQKHSPIIRKYFRSVIGQHILAIHHFGNCLLLHSTFRLPQPHMHILLLCK